MGGGIMAKFGAWIGAAFLVGVASGQPMRFDGHKVVRVSPTSVREMQAALTIADGLWSERHGVGPFEVHVAPEKLEDLQAAVACEVLVEDIQVLIDAERAANDAARQQRDSEFFDAYHTYPEIVAYVQQMAGDFPALTAFSVIGQSLQGRDIVALSVTGPGDASERPVIVFNACQHAREWASASTALYIMDTMLRAYGTDPRVTAILDSVVIKFVPMVNPDGYVYTWEVNRLWRKNRRNNGNGTFGVDLNRNWDLNFGGDGSSGNPNSETYHGVSAFSEPETAVMRDFVLGQPNAVAHIDFHTYGQLILYPWGYGDVPTDEPDRSFFEGFSQELSDIILGVHGTYYTPQQAIDLYAASGTASDWTYSVGLKGWTIELRPVGNPGFVLPPEFIRPTGQENYQAVLRFCELFAADVIVNLPQGAPETLEAGAATMLAVDIIDSIGTVEPGSGRLVFQADFATAPVERALTNIGAERYEAALPALSCGRSISYHVEVDVAGGGTVRYPATGELSAMYTERIEVYADACEALGSWTIGAPGDNATTGLWENGDPSPTAAQPGDDHSPAGTRCFVTGAAAGGNVGAFDVDGGATTLTSGPIDTRLPSDWLFGESRIEYYRWYSNDQGSSPNNDTMPVRISTDGVNWVDLESVTENANAWVGNSFRVEDFVTPGAATQLRFVAQDQGAGSIVEAAVDDVRVVVEGCRFHPSDLTQNGATDAEDFFEFLDWFAGGDDRADLNGDEILDAGDFFLYLDLFVTA